jgi:hypothetical protein
MVEHSAYDRKCNIAIILLHANHTTYIRISYGIIALDGDNCSINRRNKVEIIPGIHQGEVDIRPGFNPSDLRRKEEKKPPPSPERLLINE